MQIQTTVASAFIQPMPLVLVGVRNNDKTNFMAVGWVTRVNNQPPMFAVVINKGHYTNAAIRESGEFSIVGMDVAHKDAADYCGMNSGRKTDKGTVFETFTGALGKAPLITDAPYNIACKIAQIVELPTNTLFIGEAMEVYYREDVLTDGKPDLEKMDSLIFTMPDLRYWQCGNAVGKAWKDGAGYRKITEES